MKRLLSIVPLGLFGFSLVLLLFYSYTQIDLGLSLSRFELWHTIQRQFQEIGFFQRPLSAGIYVAILLLLTGSYLAIVFLLFKKVLTQKHVIWLSLLSAAVLFFSYNAFSYDLFNYIFDAKIVTEYGDNPYERRALDYPEDPMLGFMRWTHRVYPYGPVWLLISLPLSFASFGSLLLNILLFKGLAVASYLILVWCLMEIVKKIKLENVGFHVGLFALNPLVILESLVSSHNDIVMMVFCMGSLLFVITRRFYSSIFFYGLSVGVKFATGFLFPVFVYLFYKKGKIENWQQVITFSYIFLLLAVIAASSRTQFQPWYLLYILPFAVLSRRISIIVPTIVVSLFSLLQYLPYIYVGNYDPPIPLIMASLVSISLIVSIVILTGIFIIRKR